MRVLVDASILKPGLAGIRTYVLGVVGALARRRDVHLHVATSVPELFDEMPAVDVVRIPSRTRSFAWRAAWREAVLDRLAARTSVDLVFLPFPEMPARCPGVPTVLVVYDVGPLVAPALFTRPKRARFSLDLGRACRTATKVVCTSNATLLGLHAATGLDPDKCEVIGAAPTRHASEPAATAEAFGPYVLYVGTLLRHKNVPTLVRGFSGDGGCLPGQLLLVGPASRRERSALGDLVADLGVMDRVRHMGWVPPEELATLYGGALAVAIPSLHEGYGLPALEAMAAGAPVVASDIPALREVAGDAAVYITQPVKPTGWRDALERLCADPSWRAALATRGRDRAGAYSWEKVASQFVRLFETTVGRGT